MFNSMGYIKTIITIIICTVTIHVLYTLAVTTTATVKATPENEYTTCVARCVKQ